MAPFVEQRFHIALQSRRVHENERLAALLQRHLISARLLPFPAVQIEVSMCRKLIKLASQLRREPIENLPRLVDEQIDSLFLKRPQRRASLRVHLQIPGTQRDQLQVARPARASSCDSQRHARLRDRFGKRQALLRRVIETLVRLPVICAVIGQSRIARDLSRAAPAA